MKIYKAYKFRMYPEKEEINKINSFLGTSRFIYNYYLNKKDNLYKENNINYPLNEMKKDIKELTKDYEWLKEIDSSILRTSLDDLDRSYKNYFNKRGSHPKYKKKNNKDTYRTVAIRSSYKEKEYSNIKVDLEKRIIKLPKLKEIKIRGYRNLKDFNKKKILSVTVSKEANRYYASVLAQEEIPTLEYKLHSAIGIDVGIKNLVVTSDGIKYESMKKIEKYEKKIKGLNKALSRSQRNSKNREKIKIKLERVYQKIRNIRKYYSNIITKRLTEENDLIISEKLDIKEMIEHSPYKKLKKNIINSTFNMIFKQIEYKSKWKNKKYIQIDKYYASSQICSHCGNKNEKVKELNVRKWECKKCNNINDRDINASINILMKGIERYYKEVEVY